MSGEVLTGCWRFLRSPRADGPTNMAIDELLIERAACHGETIVRVYEWSQPTLSFGRNQTAIGVYDRAKLRDEGIAVVRRPTGGRAVLHWREVTYSIAAPVSASLRTTYAAVNNLLVDALRAIGVAAEIAAPGKRAASPSGSPCFEEPSAGELIANGRKLAASAQWRTESAMLQHGSILMENDQSRIASFMVVPVEIPEPATLSALLPVTPAPKLIADAIHEAVRHRHPGLCSLDVSIDDALVRTVANRYRDESWTWRR